MVIYGRHWDKVKPVLIISKLLAKFSYYLPLSDWKETERATSNVKV